MLALFCIFLWTAIAVQDYWLHPKNVRLDTPEQVRDFLQGTWTYTQPLVAADKYPYTWERYVFSRDSVTMQTAAPSDTQWSESNHYSITMKREKTADTGEWYWRISIGNIFPHVAVTMDKQVYVFRPGKYGESYMLTRGDKLLDR